MIQKKNEEIARENTCFLILQKVDYLLEDLLYLVIRGEGEIFVSGSEEKQIDFLEKLVDSITKAIQKLSFLRQEALEKRVKIEEELRTQKRR